MPKFGVDKFQVTVTLDKDVLELIDQRAKVVRMTRSAFVNWYFRFALLAETKPMGEVLSAFVADVKKRSKEAEIKP